MLAVYEPMETVSRVFCTVYSRETISIVCFRDISSPSSAAESKKALAANIEGREKRTATLQLSKS